MRDVVKQFGFVLVLWVTGFFILTFMTFVAVAFAGCGLPGSGIEIPDGSMVTVDGGMKADGDLCLHGIDPTVPPCNS